MSTRSTDEKRDYRKTLQLPKTDFPMRANLVQLEPVQQQRWEKLGLYDRISEKSDGLPPYILHDGPPYANGPIHIGHLLNKILKDLVVRTRMMSGHLVEFIPGWDCHGLPIEHRVLKELGPKASGMDQIEVRRLCHRYAEKYFNLQAEQMQRLGTIGDYGNPYLTMQSSYEAAVLEVFARLVEAGLVYRDLKPIHWSIANQTALAEAELEYYERTDSSVFVLFEIAGDSPLPSTMKSLDGPLSLMIWTTTPWTLPANQAVALARSAEYAVCQYRRQGRVEKSVVALDLMEQIFAEAGIDGVERLITLNGEALAEASVRYKHPFVEREGVVVSAEYVTLEDGTGLVHTAPGHGAEDYLTGVKENLPIYCPVQADGSFDTTVPAWLQGLSVWDANPKIVEHLRESGHLFHDQEYSHSYPHDWRSKTPTIFRATEQWFIGVDRPFGRTQKSLRESSLNWTAEGIRFYPESGRKRLAGMLEARPDWCISRQRSWGLPIPAFYGPEEQPFLTPTSIRAVSNRVSKKGSDCWFSDTPAQLLEDYNLESDRDAPDWLKRAGSMSELQKGLDIFDVWFESGSSWKAVLRDREIGYPSNLYLEGSDQHRGWFQLSLLPALGATERPPFEAILTHGFMVDAQNRKMSKSLGNAIEVKKILERYGSDICRWWVSSLNYTHDVKVDWEFFKLASEEYRKIRNTIRFLLSNLNDFDPQQDSHQMGEKDRYSIDSWALQELSTFVIRVLDSYQNYRFKQASEAIFNFCNDTLSSTYLAAVKDRLYCDRSDSPRRRRTQRTLYQIADELIRAVAPILVHTAEEAFLSLNNLDISSKESVHLKSLPEARDYPLAEAGWEKVLEFRHEVLRYLEKAKVTNEALKNPLDTGVVAKLPRELCTALQPFEEELADLCGVSRLRLEEAESLQIEIQNLTAEPRCERSWKRDGTVRLRSDGGMLSDRDATVLKV